MSTAVSSNPSERSPEHPTREAAMTAFVATWRVRLVEALAARFERAVGRDSICDAVDQAVADAVAGDWICDRTRSGRPVYPERMAYAFVARRAESRLQDYLKHLHRPAAPIYGVDLESVIDLHAPDLEDAWIGRETASQLREALGVLGEQAQQVLALRHIDNRERRQIAELLRLTEKQVKRHLERANKRLHEQYLSVEAGESCDDGRLVVRFAFDLAPRREARRAEAHIGHCAACRRRYARAQAYRRSVAGLIPFPLIGRSHESAAGLLDQLRLLAGRLFGQSGEEATRTVVGARGGAGAATAGAAKLLGICLAGTAIVVGGAYCIVHGLPTHREPKPKPHGSQRASAPIAAALPPSREHAVLARTANRNVALQEHRAAKHRAAKRAAARRAAGKRKASRPDEFFSPYASPETTTQSSPPSTSSTAAPASAPQPTTTAPSSSSQPGEFPLP